MKTCLSGHMQTPPSSPSLSMHPCYCLLCGLWWVGHQQMRGGGRRVCVWSVLGGYLLHGNQITTGMLIKSPSLFFFWGLLSQNSQCRYNAGLSIRWLIFIILSFSKFRHHKIDHAVARSVEINTLKGK